MRLLTPKKRCGLLRQEADVHKAFLASSIIGGYEKQVKVTFFQILTHKPPKPVSGPKILCKKLIQTQSVEKNLPDGPKN